MSFADSTNRVSSQFWAFILLIVGVSSAVVFNREKIAVELAAGIIGAALNMFNSIAQALKSEVKPLNPQQPEGPAITK